MSTGIRITTWNVNGLRNPFSFRPWRDQRTLKAMFDILEADIVILQEIKMQKKDLTDDLVLVPGWDSFFSLPKHKKGYSGVAIYTRQAKCCPIRAEEGITGQLNHTGSTSRYCDLLPDAQIGGYPGNAWATTRSHSMIDIDSEGRAIMLEFPAFVLIGVYCPASRDESRTEFRELFFETLDRRVRNLAEIGKRVVLAGDMNVSRQAIDMANSSEYIRKQGSCIENFMRTPLRRLLNQLLENGQVIGDRDEGRGQPVLFDLCRERNPDRAGMFTCWDQKVNARPSNCGARLDYIFCSIEIESWFSACGIQEGLMGSDHCPVYAILSDTIILHGGVYHTKDDMNPSGMFINGVRKYPANRRDLLSLSGRLLPEFCGRRDIKVMLEAKVSPERLAQTTGASLQSTRASIRMSPIADPLIRKREITSARSKRTSKTMVNKVAQKRMEDFFRQPKELMNLPTADELVAQECNNSGYATRTAILDSTPSMESEGTSGGTAWSRIFSQPETPRCKDHEEPCIRLTTRKPGRNFKRMFWMCARPMGPSGSAECGTKWRCSTFIWCSDWKSATHDYNPKLEI